MSDLVGSPEDRFSHNEAQLEQVQSAKYLGITITDNLDWGQHVSESSGKAIKTMGFLRRNFALAPRCIQTIGSPSARVCSTYLESLSQTSDPRGREDVEDSY